MCVSALPSTRKKDTSKPHETYCEVTCLRVKQLSTGMDLQDGTPTRRSFVHLESEIGAEEAEEIGVEHLLRDIKDTTVSTLAERVSAKLVSLKGLHVSRCIMFLHEGTSMMDPLKDHDPSGIIR